IKLLLPCAAVEPRHPGLCVRELQVSPTDHRCPPLLVSDGVAPLRHCSPVPIGRIGRRLESALLPFTSMRGAAGKLVAPRFPVRVTGQPTLLALDRVAAHACCRATAIVSRT